MDAFDFESLFELSPELLCIAGYDGYFKRINSAVAKTLGYNIEELYAKPINHFVYPADADKTAHTRKKLIEKHEIVNFENRYLTKKGEIVWFSWTAKADDERQIIFAIAKNISGKKKQEEEQIRQIEKLSFQNESYQTLSYSTSHDLRAPVDSMLAIIKLIDEAEVSDKNLQLIQLLGRATTQLKEKLSTYIDALGKPLLMDIELLNVDFEASYQNVKEAIGNLITSSNASINCNFTAAESITFNKDYLESILLNLISNSIKYAQAGIAPNINIYSDSENGQVKLVIEDNGLGFDLEKTKDKMFNLHQTFHKHPDSKGIGLYLVYTQLVSLGGSIEVESAPNQGSKFIISFNMNLQPTSQPQPIV